MSQHNKGGGAQQRGGGGGSAQSSKGATQRQAQQVQVPQRLMSWYTALSRFIHERHNPTSPIELIENDWRNFLQRIVRLEWEPLAFRLAQTLRYIYFSIVSNETISERSRRKLLTSAIELILFLTRFTVVSRNPDDRRFAFSEYRNQMSQLSRSVMQVRSMAEKFLQELLTLDTNLTPTSLDEKTYNDLIDMFLVETLNTWHEGYIKALSQKDKEQSARGGSAAPDPHQKDVLQDATLTGGASGGAADANRSAAARKKASKRAKAKREKQELRATRQQVRLTVDQMAEQVARREALNQIAARQRAQRNRQVARAQVSPLVNQMAQRVTKQEAQRLVRQQQGRRQQRFTRWLSSMSVDDAVARMQRDLRVLVQMIENLNNTGDMSQSPLEILTSGFACSLSTEPFIDPVILTNDSAPLNPQSQRYRMTAQRSDAVKFLQYHARSGIHVHPVLGAHSRYSGPARLSQVPDNLKRAFLHCEREQLAKALYSLFDQRPDLRPSLVDLFVNYMRQQQQRQRSQTGGGAA